MKQALKSIAGQRSCSASVVDGKLILSFPRATTPVVWQMDLDNAKASALEVREGKTPGTFTLTLKTPKGEAVDIAPFDNRALAVEGLMAAARALETAHGQIRPQQAGGGIVHMAARASKHASPGKWIGVFLGLALVVVLFIVLGNARPRPPSQLTGPAASGSADQQGEPGVPMSADQFLKGR